MAHQHQPMGWYCHVLPRPVNRQGGLIGDVNDAGTTSILEGKLQHKVMILTATGCRIIRAHRRTQTLLAMSQAATYCDQSGFPVSTRVNRPNLQFIRLNGIICTPWHIITNSCDYSAESHIEPSMRSAGLLAGSPSVGQLQHQPIDFRWIVESSCRLLPSDNRKRILLLRI